MIHLFPAQSFSYLGEELLQKETSKNSLSVLENAFSLIQVHSWCFDCKPHILWVHFTYFSMPVQAFSITNIRLHRPLLVCLLLAANLPWALTMLYSWLMLLRGSPVLTYTHNSQLCSFPEPQCYTSRTFGSYLLKVGADSRGEAGSGKWEVVTSGHELSLLKKGLRAMCCVMRPLHLFFLTISLTLLWFSACFSSQLWLVRKTLHHFTEVICAITNGYKERHNCSGPSTRCDTEYVM